MARRRARAPDASEASSSGGEGEARRRARRRAGRRARGRARRRRRTPCAVSPRARAGSPRPERGPRRGGEADAPAPDPPRSASSPETPSGAPSAGFLKKKDVIGFDADFFPALPPGDLPDANRFIPPGPRGREAARAGSAGETRRGEDLSPRSKKRRETARVPTATRPRPNCSSVRGARTDNATWREGSAKDADRRAKGTTSISPENRRPPSRRAHPCRAPRERWRRRRRPRGSRGARRAPRAGGWRRVGAPTAPGRAGAPRVVAPPPGIIASLARRRAGSVVLGVDISASPRAAASRRLARRVRRRARAGPRSRRARRRATRETRRPPTVTTTTATTTRRDARARTPRRRSRRRDDSRTSSRTKPPRAFARPSPPRAWSSPWTRTTTAPAELRRPRVPPRGI